MSYAPPSYNAADLTFKSGYSAPAYNASDLLFNDGTPTLSIFGSTTASFVGKADKTASFSVAASTVVDFQHWYRQFSITAGATASFVTWQRDVQISTGTSPSFYAGFVATITTSSASSLVAIAALQTEYNIAASTMPSFAWRSLNGSGFTASGKTFPAFHKRDTQPARAVFFTGSALAPKPRSVVSSSATFVTGSVFTPRHVSVFSAGYTAQGATALSGASAYMLRAAATVPASTTVTFAGLNVHARPFASPCSAASVFMSSYIYNTPPPIHDYYDAMLYVCEKRKDIFTGVKT